MPCTSGGAPVYMEAKHTGVTLGMTDSMGSCKSVRAIVPSNSAGYFSYSHRATASGLYMNILSAFSPANAALAASQIAPMEGPACLGASMPKMSVMVLAMPVIGRELVDSRI